MRAEYPNTRNERKRARAIFLGSTISKFLALQSALQRAVTSKALFANHSSSSFVYNHRMLPAVREYNASRVTCMAMRLRGNVLSRVYNATRGDCNARYRTSNVEFSNAPVRCLRVEIADNFAKIQSKYLIYLLIDKLRSDKIISCGFSSSFNRANKTANIIRQAL